MSFFGRKKEVTARKKDGKERSQKIPDTEKAADNSM